MGNIMTSMYTGVSGLRTNQTSLNTVSHNLANVNTHGYVRQQVVSADTLYNTVGDSHISKLQVGYGSTVDTIRQVRDVFLDKAYRTEVGRQGFYESQNEAAMEIESLFGELDGVPFHDDISDFWVTLQELAKEPDSIVKREAVVSQGGSLIERASTISSALKSYQSNLNTKVQDEVNRVNEIGHEIKQLNELIVSYECGSENANDLRDTRNALLDELGKIVKISYKEDMTGNVNVSIEGRQFVFDNDVYELKTTKKDDVLGLLSVEWDDGMDTPLYDLTKPCLSENNSNVGSLKGLLVARGDSSANYSDIPIRENFATDEDYASAVKTYNETINYSILKTTQAQFDQLVHGIVTAINDVLCPNTSFGDLKNFMGKDITGTPTFKVVDDKGVEVHLDDAVLVWDEENAPVGMDINHTPAQELFERKNMERYEKLNLEITEPGGKVTTKTVYVYNEEDPADMYSLYTTDQLRVNPEIQKDVSLLPLSATADQGLSDAFAMNKCKELVECFNQKFSTLSPNHLTSYTFTEYYTTFTGNIATLGNTFQKNAEKQLEVATTFDNQRSTILGVSSEEELTNMIKYQYAYGASSKYINVINDMLETIIQSMG